MSARETHSMERPQDGFFRMGRNGTIALVLVIVVALVGAGLLAGALGGRDANPAGPGGSSDFKVTSTDDGGPGSAARPAGPLSAGAGVASASIGGRAFGFGGLGAAGATAGVRGGLFQISPTPTESPFPSESPSPIAPVSGQGISLDGGTVVVPLPEGWSQITGGENYTLNFDGIAGYIYAEVNSGIDPSIDAASILPQVYQNLIVSDSHYSQLAPGEVESYEAFGGLVSRAGMWYEGEYSDTQGSYGFGGKMWVGIRGDGKAFLMTLEIYPAEDWELGVANECSVVYRPAWEGFAGQPFSYDPCAP